MRLMTLFSVDCVILTPWILQEKIALFPCKINKREISLRRPYHGGVRRPRPSRRFVTFTAEPRCPFPTGRKLRAGIVKSFPTGRKLADFLIDNVSCLCARLIGVRSTAAGNHPRRSCAAPPESGGEPFGAPGWAPSPPDDTGSCHHVYENTRTYRKLEGFA
jgi:hypothetical protein